MKEGISVNVFTFTIITYLCKLVVGQVEVKIRMTFNLITRAG